MSTRVCIIGAGASGLCSAKHALAAGMTVRVLERSSCLGGTWVYTDTVGYDDHGLPVHTSMYKSLRTNLPKEIMGFPDFPVPDGNKSYVPAAEMLKFLHSYADAHGVTEHIKFNHYVKKVKPRERLWDVSYVDLVTGQEVTEEFDAVMVCNGHYNTPFVPEIKGLQNFRGDVMHSHDYRVPEVFSGKKVLVIGAGPSGMDIALEITTVTEKVVLSHHLKEKPRSVFPDNLEQKPDVLELTEFGAIFADGTMEDHIDAVFFCTGYAYNFPFLDATCGVRVEDNRVTPLYRHLINVEHPSMCLVGVPYYVCAFSMFDLQVRYFVKYLRGGFDLPSKADMYAMTEAEFEDRAKRGYTKRQAHMMGPDQDEYFVSLSNEANIKSLPRVLERIHTFSSDTFLHDLSGFRNYTFDIENYYKSLADEADTPGLPSVLSLIRDRSDMQFLHNIRNYREDLYEIIDDTTYAIIRNGNKEVISAQ